jgi:cellulose synthase/poly-beta-1,6-N-acetylglucosamine synthase-like glycosyltransferase
VIETFCFFFCLGLLVYVFLIYPSIVIILGSLRRREITPRWTELPDVTMIFSALNEEENIAQKLENALSQDYPRDKLDVIVVDDQSTDRTSHIVKEFNSDKITLIQHEERRGKTAALNQAVKVANGEVIVFTDANAMFQPDAVRKLLKSFDSEGEVGVVCGEPRYRKHPSALSDEESLYWKMELHLKKAESNLGALLGANGPIYAMLKNLYTPLGDDIISDFISPLLLSEKGYLTVYQPEAISLESSTRSLQSEFRRKRRIIQRSLHSLWVHKRLLNPFTSWWLAIQLWSHKVLRWFTPVWLLGILITTGLNQQILFFKALFIIQILVYVAGIAGVVLERIGKPSGAFRFPAYFIMLLVAALAGIWGVVSGKTMATWEPQR